MEREVNSFALLGIVLIVLSAILGISFGAYAITRDTTSSGSTQVTDTTNEVIESWFQDYNSKRVYGTRVLELLDKANTKKHWGIYSYTKFK